MNIVIEEVLKMTITKYHIVLSIHRIFHFFGKYKISFF